MSSKTNTKNQHQNIPLVDMGVFFTGTPDEKIAKGIEFGEALHHIGFVAVTNIGISLDTINQAYVIAEKYFNQPEAIKLKTNNALGIHGYTPYGSEHAKYTDVIDLKEFFQTTGPTHPAQYWPELPGFKEAMVTLYHEIERGMHALLKATAIYLGYQDAGQQNILSNMLGIGNAVMRMQHYPPVDPALAPPGAIRASEHEDLCIMTIIPRTTHPGLQIKNNQGEWLDVIVPDDAAIINSGDTLNILTNGLIPSTTHRVVNPPEDDRSSRYSIPFFGNLIPETVLRVLDKCRNNITQLHKKELTFKDFMDERYQRIGIMKQE